MKLLACFAAITFGISLSGVKSFKDADLYALSIVGWTVALLLANGGN